MTETTPRRRRHARTRQTILDAAQEIITEQGPEGLSMRELANRIEYSPSGLYEYFASKDELLNAICMESTTMLAMYLKRVPSTLSASERLAQAGLAYLKFAADYPRQYLLMFGTTIAGPFDFQQVEQDSAYDMLQQIIRDGLANSEFSQRAGYGLTEIAYGCWALVHGLAMLRQTVFSGNNPEIDQMNRLVIEGMVTNLRTL